MTEIPRGHQIIGDQLLSPDKQLRPIFLTNRHLWSIEWHFSGQLIQNLRALTKNNSSEKIRVLDIPAGRRMNASSQLAGEYPKVQVVGLDIVPIKISRLQNLHQVQSDAFKLPFDDSSFDLVYSFGLMPYYEFKGDYQMVEKFIRDIARILNPKGVALIDARFGYVNRNCNRDRVLQEEAGIKMSPLKTSILQKTFVFLAALYNEVLFRPDDYLLIQKLI